MEEYTGGFMIVLSGADALGWSQFYHSGGPESASDAPGAGYLLGRYRLRSLYERPGSFPQTLSFESEAKVQLVLMDISIITVFNYLSA